MKRIVLAALAATFCLYSFASTNPEQREILKKKSEKIEQPKTIETKTASSNNDDAYCSTRSDMYYDGFATYSATCTRCTDGGQALADVMAQNCAFETAQWIASQVLWAEVSAP